jgi:hypothetical protein
LARAIAVGKRSLTEWSKDTFKGMTKKQQLTAASPPALGNLGNFSQRLQQCLWQLLDLSPRHQE